LFGRALQSLSSAPGLRRFIAVGVKHVREGLPCSTAPSRIT